MKAITPLVLLLLILPATTILFAQIDSGSISGTVKDEQGRPLPGTTVTARDAETGVERTMLTGSTGAYYLSPLRPSIYDVTFKLDGFMTRIEEKIAVNVGTQITLNQEMIEGTAEVKASRPAEQIEVLSTTALETSKSHVSSVVSQQQIEQLPLNGRNFLELSSLTPGVSVAPNISFVTQSSRVVQIATPGSMGRSASVVVDGMDDSDERAGGVLQSFSQDAVGEIQVLTHGFPAETGRSSSTVINVITKSGTNELHGGAFLFFRNSALQARNPIVDESTGEPPFDREQTGLSVGGPLVKDKAFWFASYEYTNEDSVTNALIRDPSGLINILAPTPVDESLGTFRFDDRINSSDSLFARYSYQGNKGTFGGGTDPSNFATEFNQFHSVVFGWSHILSNSKINEFRVAEIHFHTSADAQTTGITLNFPSGYVTGPCSWCPFRVPINRFQLKDDFTWTPGNHQIKFGGEFQIVRSDHYGPNNPDGEVFLGEDSPQGDLNGDGKTDDNDLLVDSASRPSASSTGLVPDLNNDYWAGYIQDDWHVGKGLTLNLGLRYELDTQANGANAQNERDRVHFYPNDYGVRHKDWNNFGPRLGFAWDLHNNGKTLVRGGYGIYYDRIILLVPLLERLYNGVTLQYDGYGKSYLGDPFGGAAEPAPAYPLFILSNDFQNPRVQQFGAGVEREISPNLRVSADYIRSRGDHFSAAPEVNHPRIGVTVNPDISNYVIEVASGGKMSYDGLLISATSRMWKNLQFQFSYTLARMSTISDDEYDTRAELDAADPLKGYGASGNQDTHRIVVNGMYQLPRGFQVSGIFTYASGLPFNIVTYRDFLLDGVPFDRFPLLPRNAGGREVRTGAELNRWITIFNTSNDPAIAAMRQNCNCTLPLVDPNLKFTDNFINLDLRFSKTFSIGKFQVEPIVEIFNFFNVTNIRGTDSGSLSGYVTNMESPDFGKPISTAGGAFGQGGPRAIQFALRFKF